MRSEMGRFWDRRADEDAYFFVDNRMKYRRPDPERFWAHGERDLDELLTTLGVAIDSGQRVLEIGCGVGRLTRVIGSRARSVLALDVSERMLELAKRHNAALTNVEWMLGDGSTLSQVDSGSVDACISSLVFQHIPDAEITLAYIAEMGRVLKPGGWAAFQISNDPRVHDPGPRLDGVIRAVLATLGQAPRGQRDQRWRGSMVELDALRGAAAEGSMQVERIVGAGTQFCGVLTRRR